MYGSAEHGGWLRVSVDECSRLLLLLYVNLKLPGPNCAVLSLCSCALTALTFLIHITVPVKPPASKVCPKDCVSQWV